MPSSAPSISRTRRKRRSSPPAARPSARSPSHSRYECRCARTRVGLQWRKFAKGLPMIARPTVSLALLALLLAPAAADEPKVFACSFTAGVTHAYDKGQFTAEKASPLNFGIAAIDHNAQT